MRADYRIYPSLLDKFQDLLDADVLAEQPWNFDEDGAQRLTSDEIASTLENELLDAVNRVQKETTEAQARGTCFNLAVDCVLDGAACLERDGARAEVTDGSVLARLGLFGFAFGRDLIEEAAGRISRVKGISVQQHLCSAPIETGNGLVELYGYADETVIDKVYDLKAVSSYSFGKYERCWQKLVYPYCLVKSGEADIKSFVYIVAQMWGPTRSCPLATGRIYEEEYTFDMAFAEDRLRGMCGAFIGWLEANRDRITDKKIFGGDETD